MYCACSESVMLFVQIEVWYLATWPSPMTTPINSARRLEALGNLTFRNCLNLVCNLRWVNCEFLPPLARPSGVPRSPYIFCRASPPILAASLLVNLRAVFRNAIHYPL